MYTWENKMESLSDPWYAAIAARVIDGALLAIFFGFFVVYKIVRDVFGLVSAKVKAKRR